MPDNRDEIIAKLSKLEDLLMTMRVSAPRRTIVLFLGARAGELYQNTKFFNEILQLGITEDTWSQPKKFGHCYRILDMHIQDEQHMQSTLGRYLNNTVHSEADVYVAELIKKGYFDTVISTNIDNVLDQMLPEVGMSEGQDFAVLIPKPGQTKELLQDEREFICRIIKVHGDYYSMYYNTVKNEINLDEDEQHGAFKAHLCSLLKRDILIVGYDPFWDRDIASCFPTKGGSIWYINEEEPVGSIFTSMLEARRAECIIGPLGSYKMFMERLGVHLLGGSLVNYKLLSDMLVDKIDHLSDVLMKKFKKEVIQDIHLDISKLQEDVNRLSKLIES